MALCIAPGSPLILDGRTYFLHPERIAACLPQDLIDSLQAYEKDFVPLSVFHAKATFDQVDLSSVRSRFSQTDDVWCSSFASSKSLKLSMILLSLLQHG